MHEKEVDLHGCFLEAARAAWCLPRTEVMEMSRANPTEEESEHYPRIPGTTKNISMSLKMLG